MLLRKKVLSVILFVLILNSSYGVFAQTGVKTYIFDPVNVTATRLGQKYAATRSVTRIDREQIERLPIQSVAHLLNYALGVSMNSRGTPGVQSDPSLRGAGFEQVLILLDGVRMNDPQTGHHNTNLPVTINDIERIEVLRGQSSALHGPDAFGGTINIITRRPAGKNFTVTTRGGSFKTAEATLSVSLPLTNQITNRFSVESARSDGYREDTDYVNTVMNWRTVYSAEKMNLTLSAGLNDKDFGANEFYVKGYDHYEETRAVTGGISGIYSVTSQFTTTANINFKRHEDYFILSRKKPSMYEAEHTTERILIDAAGNYNSALYGEFTFGAEVALEDITSSTLGTHDVNRTSVFGEYGKTLPAGLLFTGGLRIDKHSEWGTEINPSVSLGYFVRPDIILKASAGRAFRAPTFTELYSPAASQNRGNQNLKPEKAIAMDIGFEYSPESGPRYQAAIFYRDQSETIDWIKDTPETIYWRAVNIFDIRSAGFEQELSWKITGGINLRLTYTFLDQNKKQTGFISKYALIHPRHQIMIAPSFDYSEEINFTPVFSYKEMPGLDSFSLFDAKLTYKILDNIRLNIEGLNLSGIDYREIRDVPMPGRSLYAGVSFVY